MKDRKTILVPCLFLITIMTTIGYSQRVFKRHKSPLFQIERFAGELGLSEEQLSTIKVKRFEIEKHFIELSSQIQLADLELRELMNSEKPDMDEIKRKIEKIGRLKSDLHFTKVQGQLEIKNILTSEQLEKLKDLKKKRMKRRMQRGRRFRK